MYKETQSDKLSSPKKHSDEPLSRIKEKEVITPTLKIEPRSPRVQQLTISPVENNMNKSSMPFPRRSPPNLLKRVVTFKDSRDVEIKSSTRVFPSPRQSQVQILNQLKKNAKDIDETRSVL